VENKTVEGYNKRMKLLHEQTKSIRSRASFTAAGPSSHSTLFESLFLSCVRYINNSFYLARKNRLRCYWADIVCSERRTVFQQRSSRKTVGFGEQTMSADKYPSIFLSQMEAVVYIRVLPHKGDLILISEVLTNYPSHATWHKGPQ